MRPAKLMAPALVLALLLTGCGMGGSIYSNYRALEQLRPVEILGVDADTRGVSVSAAAKKIGAERIVIHSGSCSKITREEALELAKDTLLRARKAAVEAGFEDIIFCPETMGKFNQLGNLEEVLELCRLDDTFLPTVDFGHLNARTLGEINSKEAFERILDDIGNKLGTDRLKRFHSHFSKIEYTQGGGEKRHLTFEDEIYGPRFEPLMELIAKRGLHPTFICESAGTQDIDALAMKKCYLEYL